MRSAIIGCLAPKIFPVCLFAFGLITGTAYGWDTAVKESGTNSDWRSIYESTVNYQGGKVSIRGNEHAEISAMALAAIGAGKLLIKLPDAPMVVDINASYFHRNRPGETFAPSDAPRDGLERRFLPPPAQFSGIPDFSYSIYDWINKNALCPAIPPGADAVDQCHAYTGWLGAGLNASHFGTQAALNYKRLHKLALSIADLTRSVRVRLEEKPDALDAYRDFIREGEWMALAYEGFALHFMVDRWSTGHMWERWNAGDYEHLADKKLSPNRMVGVISGLIHGWEGGFHGRVLVKGRGLARNLFPDPLSAPWVVTEGKRNPLTRAWRWWVEGKSPQFSLTKIEPSVWRHLSKDIFRPGVGDNLLVDMMDGQFGKQYGFVNSLPLNVPTQRIEMMACVEAGWVETIRALGKNKEGAYGIENISLNGDAPTFTSLKHDCFDQFVTNQSIAYAWPFTRPTFWSKLGRATLIVLNNPVVQKTTSAVLPTTVWRRLIGKENIKNANMIGKILTRISARIWLQSKQHADGIELAAGYIPGGLDEINMKPIPVVPGDSTRQGILPVVSPWKYAAYPGSKYGVASYLPPDDIHGLPDKDEKSWRGRDLESIYGFFSKAGAHHWCEKLPDLLPQLRESRNPKDHAVCKYLADFAYQGTDPDYAGKQTEKRTSTSKPEGTVIPSFCQALGITFDDKNAPPSYLPPGYVDDPYRRSEHELTYASAGAWCDRVPILYLLADKDKKNRDVVAEVKDPNDSFTIQGADLGNAAGQIHMDCEGGSSGTPLDVVSWSEQAVTLRLPGKYTPDAGMYSVCLIRADGKKTVGRFVVEIVYAQQVISGKVFSESGDAVSGAMVNAEIGGKQYTGRSGADGGYQINLPEDIKVPGTLIVMANKKGYNTGSTSVGKSTFEHADITLSTVSKNTIQIDKSLHHLGNSDYAGVANSQFQQPKAEGGTYEKSFEIKPEQLPSNYIPAELTLTVKGSEGTNPVFINATQIGGLGITSSDGSASKVEIRFDVCAIRLGKNIVRIKSHVENDDIDDFEFANIQLVMNPAEEIAMDDKQLSKLSSISVTAGDFGAPLPSVEPGGYFWITAQGESRCAGLKDRARVVVYAQGTDASKGKQVQLTETGPNSSIFHSEKVPVAQIQTKPGQKIIVRSGLRGTSVRITGGLAVPKPSGKSSNKSQAKDDLTNKGKGGTTGSAPNKTTAGANSGGGQMVIPVNAGSSRKAAGVPVQAPAAGQAAAKPVQWVVYKLESYPDPHGGLPKLKVVKIAFRRSAKLAQLHVRSYPVSLSRNDQTGEILWSVNWSNGEIEDQRLASTPAAMEQLQQQADGMKPGTVAKGDLAALIGRQLGPDSRHL